MEREVIKVEYRYRMGEPVPVYSFDYSGIEIGDWFIAKGAAQARSVGISIGKHPVAAHWTFEREPHGRVSTKFTRIA